MTTIDLLSIIGSMAAMLYYAHRDIQAEIKIQSARSDKLYEMFLNAQEENHKRFCDILKEKK